MRKLKIFSLILTLFVLILNYQNCAQNQMQTNHKSLDPEFIDYINAFSKEAAIRNLSLNIDQISIRFTDYIVEKKGIVGYCYREPHLGPHGDIIGLNPVIIIKKEWWKKQLDFKKFDLIFHELGHCLLDRKHVLVDENKSIIENLNGYSESIMTANLVSTRMNEAQYLASWQILVDELFLNRKANLQLINTTSPPSSMVDDDNERLSTEKFYFDEDNGCQQINN